ncbi:MAG: [protein-PII] uridylyltransferase family protein [Ignavibacteriaceae bacterium]
MVKGITKYKLSEEFVEKLAAQTAGYLSTGDFEKIMSLVEEKITSYYFSFSSESNLLRIISSLYDKVTFLLECLKYPNYIDTLLAISVNSNYLTDIIVRNPEYFYRILNPANLNSKLKETLFAKEINQSLQSYNTFPAKLNALRFIKRKEILRIGTKDILGISSLIDVTEELSTLAKVISAELFSLCYNEILSRNNLRKVKQKYCLFALGKLGGNELNYSSDIDLIVFYDKNSLINGRKYYSELLIEAIYLFIESTSSITGAGYIYRVDFRLRPDGRNSPLCGAFDEYLSYYESRGEDWERQMLIKSRFIAGSKILYRKFSDSLSHFIYPNSFSISPTEQIKKLKSSIERNLTGDENIKLAAGGIRDIEFSVQALQLLNGGKIDSLRTGNTLEAIGRLRENALLSENEKEVLDDAYFFYRKIEHYLQMMNDSQTHTIPATGEILEKLCAFLDFQDPSHFRTEVAWKRKEVIKIYNSIMGIDVEKKMKSEILPQWNFANKNQAAKDFSFLREGKGLLGQKQFDKNASTLFEAIEPELIKYLERAINPDRALQNFVRVIRSSNLPSIWYRELNDKFFFNSFLKLCEYSQKAIDLFAEDAELGEFIMTRKVFDKFSRDELTRFSTKKILLILAIQFSLQLMTASKLSEILSVFIRDRIKILTEKKFSSIPEKVDYFVAAMGSLGSGEMTFSSDIDLIFIVEGSTKNIELERTFQQLLTDIKKELFSFDVDCRLRPEGKSSQLVWDLISYKNYLLSRARTWELQSLCKLHFICGSKSNFTSLVKTAAERIAKEEKEKIRKDIIDMRRKLYPKDISTVTNVFSVKKSRGGISDLEFVLQIFMLKDEKLFLKSFGKETMEIISILFKENLKIPELEKVKLNFLFLKKVILMNQTVFNISTSLLSFEKNKLDILSKQLEFKSSDEFHLFLSNVIKQNSHFFEKYAG